MTDVVQWLVMFVLAATALALMGRVVSLTNHVDALELTIAQLTFLDERRCRVCHCTDDVACWSGCWWVEDDLCSSCADDQAAAGTSLEGGRG